MATPADDLQAIFDLYADRLAAAGWQPVFEQGSEDCAIELYARFKNGKWRKNSSLCLLYVAFAYESVVTKDGGFERANLRPRTRPWTVRGNGGANIGTWSEMQPALETFLRKAGL